MESTAKPLFEIIFWQTEGGESRFGKTSINKLSRLLEICFSFKGKNPPWCCHNQSQRREQFITLFFWPNFGAKIEDVSCNLYDLKWPLFDFGQFSEWISTFWI